MTAFGAARSAALAAGDGGATASPPQYACAVCGTTESLRWYKCRACKMTLCVLCGCRCDDGGDFGGAARGGAARGAPARVTFASSTKGGAANAGRVGGAP